MLQSFDISKNHLHAFQISSKGLSKDVKKRQNLSFDWLSKYAESWQNVKFDISCFILGTCGTAHYGECSPVATALVCRVLVSGSVPVLPQNYASDFTRFITGGLTTLTLYHTIRNWKTLLRGKNATVWWLLRFYHATEFFRFAVSYCMVKSQCCWAPRFNG